MEGLLEPTVERSVLQKKQRKSHEEDPREHDLFGAQADRRLRRDLLPMCYFLRQKGVRLVKGLTVMSSPRYPRGSDWRKWDLQVHTPASLKHNYPGPNPWKSFLEGLENLPPEFKVIGINDYLFLDGYERVLREKKNGRLQNIMLFLPVIELRLDKFGGSVGHLSRVNYHVIFSDEVQPGVIRYQFINAFCKDYILTPGLDGVRTRWKAIPTRDSLTDLGNLIKDSVPPNERHRFGDPLIEGFNNLCFSLDTVNEALKSHYFTGKYLTAVGKAEWADVKWNDHTIAEKKNIINPADIVFVSAESAHAWERAKRSLQKGGVNHRLLDCSDAHTCKTSEKDRLGNCFTWIKADPTFKGLMQVVNEFEERVFVGDTPPSIARVRDRPTRVMKSVSIKKRPGSTLAEKWFDCSIPINAELVAIIGNKGSGKSALADAIGLLGNTRRHREFTFLREDRFRDPRDNKAGHFEASLLWADDTVEGPVSLDQDPDPQAVERVRYIPQNYLESICNEVRYREDSPFYAELQRVIFSHVPEAERLGYDNLESLLRFHANETDRAIDSLIAELREVTREIVVHEERLKPRHRKALEAELAEKRRELQAHERARPKEVPQPEADPATQKQVLEISDKLKIKQEEMSNLVDAIAGIKSKDLQLARRLANAEKLLGRLQNLSRQVVFALKTS